jgi:ABC-type branched-subunit amino acid transport system substrate-binding protein
MKRRGMSVIAAVAVVAAAFASTAGAGSTAAAKTQAVSCKGTLKLAMVAPFTGGAGFLGNEQLSWTKYAVKTLAPKYGLKIKLVTGDLPAEAGPAVAQTVAQKYVADKTVVAVVGPSTSGTVASSLAVLRTSRRRRPARR